MIFYLIYRAGQFIALAVPLKISYKIAIWVSDIRLFFNETDQKETYGNLKTIFPEKTDAEIKQITKNLFRNFAKYLVDFFRFNKLTKEYVGKNIEIRNIDYFHQGLNEGKGVIVLTAHIGNWELGGAVVALLGFPFWAVALTHRHKAVDDFFNHQRKMKGVNTIPLSRAARQCLVRLKENVVLALVGDRDFTEDGMVLDFFGKKAIFPEGPAAFSLKTGSPIICGFMLRKPDDTFVLEINKPIEFKPSGDKKKDIKDLMQLYIPIFESYIRKYPDQWYMFKKFWIE
ncbi:MAG: lysophospholipid acyltransferase family protein [Candidatus Omnitrophica bacterium]|nr:lysophospholipid acyltransferase family protein [Candidatus Omnitrophota bacterium]